MSRRKPRVTVLGFDGSPPSPQARRALAEATLVIGNIRHLDALPIPETARRIYMGGLGSALTHLALHDGSAVVVASGDPGFFGVVRALRDQEIRVRTLPAISSMAAAFGRIGMAWEDALVVAVDAASDGVDPGERAPSGRSVYDPVAGRPVSTLRTAANLCRAHPKVAVFTGPGAGPRELAVELLGADKHPLERTLVVAQRLGEVEESVEWLSLQEAAERHHWGEPSVVLCIDEDRAAPPRPPLLAGWGGPPGGWALAENAFVHRSARITTSEVRALALARLAPRPGQLVWDVGAGSGSVGIECARLGAAVIAIERDADSCERIDLNATMHGVQLRVVRGQAPAALLDLPQPDSVMVGGGGVEVIRAAINRDPRIVVVTLSAIDRLAEAKQALKVSGRKVDGVLLQSSRLAALPGDAHRFAAVNPEFVLWGERL
ncbi:MAG TPA: precorrin-6y C5,15-methyltransferase (decarboxylating) subunit CbiE [Actinocrinis sp.]|uniref:precorrin-6y C5,15-methyltransferase (decarboxylating) subunit CbiE n=1 Tax=Actinocrinis sp. TaxID=1920516 RepID=UPI002DDCAFDC|nr:precorrin-6y C5,15-methyltransferase (decarboxylating) subunit CbiE [Actinocrinis sp.]HEV2343373.1 precorrin-6y C5,15-methyltransferase (decarboxylating) subunit CbiE [Actinocrinis sp.]